MRTADDYTHPVQLVAICTAAALNVVFLAVLNRHKKNQAAESCGWSWDRRRNTFWALMAAIFAIETGLDISYPISTLMLPIKAYSFAFSVGLLDLFFSETKGVPLKVVAGAALWCSTVLLRQMLVSAVWPLASRPLVVREATVRSALVEAARFVGSLPVIGLLSDLIFSPMHRLAHRPSLYKGHHRVHHEYTTHLTALVLFHGALLDDFLMPASTIVGGFVFVALLSLVGLEGEAFSSTGLYLMSFNILMSHAHDVRCARLLAPLPDSLNFVAYHYVHHMRPSSNFGLTKPSDLLWDWLLGVRTIQA